MYKVKASQINHNYSNYKVKTKLFLLSQRENRLQANMCPDKLFNARPYRLCSLLF